jgi:hypothetical protein
MTVDAILERFVGSHLGEHAIQLTESLGGRATAG